MNMSWYKKVLSQMTPGDDPSVGEYEIRTMFVGILRKKVEILQRKALKLNIPPMEITVSPPYIKEVTIDTVTGYKVPLEFVKVKLVGSPPQLADWEFVARLDHEEAGNIINSAPGWEGKIPQSYRQTGPSCDQCRINRYRINTYIVRNVKTNEFKQVGGECMKDFLGHPNPQQYATYLNNLISLFEESQEYSEDENYSSSGKDIFPVKSILEIASSIIKTIGYSSSKNNFSTKQMTTMMLISTSDQYTQKMLQELVEKGAKVTNEDTQKADEVIAWAKSLPEDLDDIYLQNLKVLLSSDYAKIEHIGFIVSAFIAKDRYEGVIRKQKGFEDERAQSNFVGQPGQKILVGVEFLNKMPIETNFGTTMLYLFKDDKNNKYSMFSTSGGLIDLNPKEKIILLATIKSHYTDKNGVKSTTLTRGKIIQNNNKDIQKATKAADIVLFSPNLNEAKN
jgi:hypothetical protein